MADARQHELEDRLRQALEEAGYATLGAGEWVTQFVRDLLHASEGVSDRLRETPELLAQFFEQTATRLRDEYGGLSSRGRRIAGQLKEEERVSQAVDATRAAGQRVVDAVKTVGGRAAGELPGASTAPPLPSKTELRSMKVAELRDLAGELDLEGRSDMKKAELIDVIDARR